jgi:hypothetical protein
MRPPNDRELNGWSYAEFPGGVANVGNIWQPFGLAQIETEGVE